MQQLLSNECKQNNNTMQLLITNSEHSTNAMKYRPELNKELLVQIKFYNIFMAISAVIDHIFGDLVSNQFTLAIPGMNRSYVCLLGDRNRQPT